MPSLPPEDPEREERLTYEILVDTYDVYEVAAAWSTYLGDGLELPFTARWPHSRDLVEVFSLASDEECEAAGDILVRVRAVEEKVPDRSVPLSEIEPIDATEATARAIADWQYWVAQGNSIAIDDEDDY